MTKVVRLIFTPLWKCWLALWFAIPLIVLFPAFYISMISGKLDFTFKLKRLWARTICFGTFLYPSVQYRVKKYKLPRPCIVVPNHTSYLDIVFIPFYVDHTAVFMGKAELLKLPLFKYFFHYLDVPVNRKSITGSHKALADVGKKIDQGLSAIIYPEGTISSNGHLKAFKNGAFKLAIEKQIPIVPVANLNNWWFLENGGFFKSNGRPGFPKIVVGEPIPTAGLELKDADELKDKVRNFIASELEVFYGKQH